MERGVINLHQPPVADGELEAKSAFQTMMDDYLRLKKEVVSKKRRMRNLKKKKSLLRAEVRFLRKRYGDFLKTRSSLPKNIQRNQSFIDANPYETAPVSYPIMIPQGNLIEGERVEVKPVERLSKKKKQNHTQSVNGRTPKKTVEKQRNLSYSNAAAGPVSYPIMGNKIGEGERVEMEQVERLSKKRKQSHNQTQSVNGRTPKKTVGMQINHSHSNAAAPVSYPIMESSIEETQRVEMEGGDQIRVEELSKNNRLVVDNTENMGKKKKRVTWKDQVVPKV